VLIAIFGFDPVGGSIARAADNDLSILPGRGH
jgi:hypothetical protein